jgi:hypothetical protein
MTEWAGRDDRDSYAFARSKERMALNGERGNRDCHGGFQDKVFSLAHNGERMSAPDASASPFEASSMTVRRRIGKTGVDPGNYHI